MNSFETPHAGLPNLDLRIAWPMEKIAVLAGRCSLWDVEIVNPDMPDYDLYEAGALVPTNRRPCPVDFLRPLLATSDTPASCTLELVAVTEDVFKKLADPGEGEHPMKRTSDPGTTTTTPSRKGLLVGVHIDDGPGRRIAGYNEGPGNRDFLIATRHVGPLNTGTLRQYVTDNPGKLELLGVSIRPYQMYVGPVEEYAHDGSTKHQGTRETSTIVMKREHEPGSWPIGHFGPPA